MSGKHCTSKAKINPVHQETEMHFLLCVRYLSPMKQSVLGYIEQIVSYLLWTYQRAEQDGGNSRVAIFPTPVVVKARDVAEH